jgi:glutamate formiminotransferase
VTLLDYSGDPSHNRSVFTLVGDEEGIKHAAFEMAKYAVSHIDLTKHKGEHPRMGCVDVIPFVPVKNVTMTECVKIATETGEKIAKELNIPVFLYEEAATEEKRRNLAAIRKGQFEGMGKKIEAIGLEAGFRLRCTPPYRRGSCCRRKNAAYCL